MTQSWLVALGVGVAVIAGGGAVAETDTARVNALLRDVQSADFDRSASAAQELAKYGHLRARIAPALVKTLRAREWPRCAGDMRDTIARTLIELHARDAVLPLLELAASGKSIDHECVE